jgi:hypothetical protein
MGGNMSIELGDINYLAVVVGVLLSMAGGALWYSPLLFANVWMAENGFTKEQLQEAGQAWQGYVVSIVGSIISVLILAALVQLTDADDFGEGLIIGLFAGLFVAIAMATNYSFESRPLKLYLINASYPVFVLAINGTILALWT